MRWHTFLTLVIALFLGAGCTRSLSASEARKALESPDPLKRQEGATALQKLYAKDSKAFGDHGLEHWTEVMKKVLAAPADEQRRLLEGVEPKGGEGGGGGFSEKLKLDDYWSAFTWGEQRDHRYTGAEPVFRDVVDVHVERPANFTGTWTTYFVNGAVHYAFELGSGVLLRSREYHDNGRIRTEQIFMNGDRHGHVLTFFDDGSIEREETFMFGRQVDVEKWFYPGGKPREETHWLDGKRDGRSISFLKDGSKTCIDYKANVEVSRGCEGR